MATERRIIVDTDATQSPDYSSMAAAEAGEQGDISLSSGSDEFVVFECRATTGVADDYVTFDGWTTETDNYVQVEAVGAHRHNGVWDDAKYQILHTSWHTELVCNILHFRVDGLQIRGTGAYDHSPLYGNSAGVVDWRFSNCIIRGSVSAGNVRGIKVNDPTGGQAFIWNNICYDRVPGGTGGGIGVSSADSPFIAYVYNNTVIGGEYGIEEQWSPASVLKNNVCVGQSTAAYTGNGHAESTHNAYDSGGDPGSNGVDVSGYTDDQIFNDPDNGDYTLLGSASPLYDAGVDLSADTYLPFSTDIQGDARGASWDIGADEYAGGGPATYQATASLDALIRRTGIAQSVAVDALLQASASTAVDLDAVLMAVRNEQLSLDGLAQMTIGQSLSTDALVQAVLSGVVSIDAFLWIVQSQTADLDARIRAGALSQALLDGLVQALQSAGVSMDAVVGASDGVATALDAMVRIPGSESAELDARIQAPAQAQALFDAVVQAVRSAGVSMDAIIGGAGGVFASMDAMLAAAAGSLAGLDALVQVAGGEAAVLDAVLSGAGLTAVSIDALVRTVQAGVLSLDALLVMPHDATVSLEAMLYALRSGAASMDAILVLLSGARVDTDALLLLANYAGVSLDCIFGEMVIICRQVLPAPPRRTVLVSPGRLKS